MINANEQLKEKNNKIRTLTENNKAFNLRVESLNNNIKEKDKEIFRLNSIITDIKSTLNYWKYKFDKLISFLSSKLHNWYDKDDKYIDVVNDMYKDDILDDEEIENLDFKNDISLSFSLIVSFKVLTLKLSASLFSVRVLILLFLSFNCSCALTSVLDNVCILLYSLLISLT